MRLAKWKLKETNTLTSILVLVMLAGLLSACGSAASSSSTYTPEELYYGVGCHRGPNIDTYCD